MSIDEKVKKVFFELLKNSLNGEEITLTIKNLIDENLLNNLYLLSKKHDLAHLIFLALENSGIDVKENLFKKLKNEKNVAVFRSKQIDHELKSLGDVLEEENVEFIFLKGAVIRSFYPEPWMRTSCDIDLLIKEKDVKKAKKILQEKLSYKFTGKTSHDVQFQAESGVPIELHFNLLKGDDEVSKLLEKVWDSVKKTSLNQKILTDEFFYFYHIAHMATHFKQGGCGIRNFIDLYLINKTLKIDKKILEHLLKKAGLLTFEKSILSVGAFILENTKESDIVSSILDFVLNTGMYSDVKNRASINHAKKGGKNKYFLSRVFLSRDELSVQYPKLRKYRILYLFYSVSRWGRLLFGKDAKRVRREIKIANSIKDENVKKARELVDKLKI